MLRKRKYHDDDELHCCHNHNHWFTIIQIPFVVGASNGMVLPIKYVNITSIICVIQSGKIEKSKKTACVERV